jgi:hypothetical protein
VTHQAPTKDPQQIAGTVIGAVAGGVLGNQIGGGKGRTVERRCPVYDSAEKPDGYEVRYRLGDQEGTVRADHDPGRSLPVEDGRLVPTSLAVAAVLPDEQGGWLHTLVQLAPALPMLTLPVLGLTTTFTSLRRDMMQRRRDPLPTRANHRARPADARTALLRVLRGRQEGM